ncbi:MAG TPA: tetratricopeptide repeat protein [Bacteroidales bacterium]|nr:tetratricopeptide repeat protein [Bacteroidales bacterium]HPM13422.1 tetratricopeptide repeat protein [Bacteroidales bacterium]
MAHTNETNEPQKLEKIESTLGRAELYIEQNQKKLTYIVGAVLIVVAGFIAYRNFVISPRETEVQNVIWQAQNAFAKDSFNIALYGNESVMGFSEIVDEYGSTKAGNLAKAYAGFCCIKLGEYENAISYLEDFEVQDPVIMPLAKSAIGDAYTELGNLDKAVAFYLEAAELSSHELSSPLFLMKAGMVYEKMGKKDKALEVYTKIKDEYPTSNEASSIDKYITRVSFK